MTGRRIKNKTAQVILLFVATFTLKLGLILYFTQLMECQKPGITQGALTLYAGDSFSYTGAIDNLIERGEYYFWNGKRNVYAGRLPHYGVPYYFFRLLFDKASAADLLVILQIAADAAAAVFLAFLCYEITGRRLCFWLGYVFYLLSFNFSILAQYLSPESLSLSLFIIFLYFFHRYWQKRLPSALLASGCLLAAVVVLKPYLLPVYVPLFVSVLVKENITSRSGIISFLKKGAILSFPLLLLLLPWIVRNYVVLDRFIPAQENMTAGYNYTGADFAYRRFVAAWGGNMISWDPSAVGCYFEPKPHNACNYKFPDYAFADGYDLSDVEDVREDYVQLQSRYDAELEKKVIEKFDRLTNIYKSEKPFMYYVGSQFLAGKNLLWHTNNNNLPINPAFACYKFYQLLFKLIQFAIYLMALTFGAIGLAILVYKKKLSFLFVFVPVYLIGFFSYTGWGEPRYINHAYPVMLLGLVFVLYRLTEIFEKTFLKRRDIPADENTF